VQKKKVGGEKEKENDCALVLSNYDTRKGWKIKNRTGLH
jgi:hypothetical protein